MTILGKSIRSFKYNGNASPGTLNALVRFSFRSAGVAGFSLVLW